MKPERKPKLPVVIPALKPRNPLGKQRKSTVVHQDKRKKQKHKRKHSEDFV